MARSQQTYSKGEKRKKKTSQKTRGQTKKERST